MSDLVPSNGRFFPTGSQSGIPIVVVLGPNGQPLNNTPVKLNEQDSQRSMIAGYDAFLASIFPISQFHPDTLIAHRGYEFLYNMMTMGAVRTPIDLKLQAALYKGIKVLPVVGSKKTEKIPGDYEKSQEALDYIQYLVDNVRNPETGKKTPFRAVVWQILQGVAMGFSVNNLIWRIEDSGKYKGSPLLKSVVHLPCEQIGFELDLETMEVLNIVSTTPATGRQKTVLPLEKVALYTYKPRRQLPYGDGDLRSIAKHHWSLDNVLRWWGIAQKRFGSPFLEAITNNPSKVEPNRIMLDAVQQGASLSHMETDTINFHQLNSSSLDSFETFASYHCMQIMQIVLGNTLTTSQGKGSSSYALGQTHESSQNFFLSMPRHDAEEIVTQQIFEKAIRYKFGEDYVHLTPRLFLGHWDDAERKLIAEVYQICVEMGVFHPQEDWVRDELNFPKMPEGFEPDDRMMPLLPGRERILDDISKVPGGKKVPADKSAEFYNDMMLYAGKLMTEKYSVGLTKDIEEANQ